MTIVFLISCGIVGVAIALVMQHREIINLSAIVREQSKALATGAKEINRYEVMLCAQIMRVIIELHHTERSNKYLILKSKLMTRIGCNDEVIFNRALNKLVANKVLICDGTQVGIEENR